MDEYLYSLFGAPNLSTTITIVTALALIVAYYVIRDWGVPPGPIGIPILGYWPFIRSDICHTQLLDMKKKYGDVFSFRITGKLYINLAGLKTLREAHVTKSDYFTERTMDYNLVGKVFKNAVVYSNGEKWQTTRKFFLNQFRERGMNAFKENTAEAMSETTSELIQELREQADKPIEILNILINKSNKIIRQTLYSMTSPVTESQVNYIQQTYRVVTKLVHSSNMILIGNLARYLVMPFLPNYKEGMKVHTEVTNMLLEIVENHRRTFDEDNIRDIIDTYINEKNIRRSKGDPTYEHFTDESLVANLLQFTGDGVINVATFVTFFLMSLLDYPEEQEKIYEELKEVCGEDRNPGLADKSKLTYTNAFLLEAQRYNNFVPIFPSLQCTQETTINGYRIPKGAITLSNIYSIHNDPEVYEEPRKFNPSRFLSSEGKPKEESPIMFGVGKRVCLGEAFVMMQAFLFCTAIVKNFKISYYRPKSMFELFVTRNLEIKVTPR